MNKSDAECFCRKLCHAHTDFCEDEIQCLLDYVRCLPVISQTGDCDAYIDIPQRENPNEAVVLWEALRAQSKHPKGFFLGKTILRENEPAIFRTLESGDATKDILARSLSADGTIVWTRQNVSAIKWNGKTIGALIFDIDTSQQEEASQKIRHLESQQSKLVGILSSVLGTNAEVSNLLGINEALFFFDHCGEVCYTSAGAEQLYMKMDGKTDQNFDNIWHYIGKNYQEFLVDKQPIEKEIHINHCFFKAHAVYLDHPEISAALVIQEITEFKNKSLELAANMVSSREIQHRIKNNLQTISSLLRLQSRNCVSAEAKNALQEGIMRIESITAAYQTILITDDGQVPLRPILEKICENIGQLYEGYYQVQILIMGADFNLDSTTATTVSLICNELLQNAFKHAFKDTLSGEITLSAACEGNLCTISVMDNGTGMEETTRKQFGTGLGSSILIGFIEDHLEGQWKLQSDENGTQFTFCFSI